MMYTIEEDSTVTAMKITMALTAITKRQKLYLIPIMKITRGAIR